MHRQGSAIDGYAVTYHEVSKHREHQSWHSGEKHGLFNNNHVSMPKELRYATDQEVNDEKDEDQNDGEGIEQPSAR